MTPNFFFTYLGRPNQRVHRGDQLMSFSLGFSIVSISSVLAGSPSSSSSSATVRMTRRVTAFWAVWVFSADTASLYVSWVRSTPLMLSNTSPGREESPSQPEGSSYHSSLYIQTGPRFDWASGSHTWFNGTISVQAAHGLYAGDVHGQAAAVFSPSGDCDAQRVTRLLLQTHGFLLAGESTRRVLNTE